MYIVETCRDTFQSTNGAWLMKYFHINLVNFRQCAQASSPWHLLPIHASNRLIKSAKSDFCKRFNPGFMMINTINAMGIWVFLDPDACLCNLLCEGERITDTNWCFICDFTRVTDYKGLMVMRTKDWITSVFKTPKKLKTPNDNEMIFNLTSAIWADIASLDYSVSSAFGI